MSGVDIILREIYQWIYKTLSNFYTPLLFILYSLDAKWTEFSQ